MLCLKPQYDLRTHSTTRIVAVRIIPLIMLNRSTQMPFTGMRMMKSHMLPIMNTNAGSSPLPSPHRTYLSMNFR